MKKSTQRKPNRKDAPVPARASRTRLWVGLAAALLAGVVVALLIRPKTTPNRAVFSEPTDNVSATKPAIPSSIKPVSVPAPPAGRQSVDVASLLTGPRDKAGENTSAAAPKLQRKKTELAWNGVDPAEKEAAAIPAMRSNIHKIDYAGAESCRECHQENYDKWMNHSHRVMNALATEDRVAGDFNDTEMDYLGGKVRFSTKDGDRFMELARDGVRRVYRVTRTIGSRFTQYYVGRLVEGPEKADATVREIDHLLPIGWWIDRREWVPVVHIDEEGPDGTRWDAFAKVSDVPYDSSCSVCHTTRAMGDWILNPNGILRMGFHAPESVVFDARAYLKGEHPDLASVTDRDSEVSGAAQREVMKYMRDQNMVDDGVNLGISCESCHNGAREHVRASDKNKSAVLPHFFPAGDEVLVASDNPHKVFGKNKETINFICARCHTGKRPYYAGGMATWNSVEFADAEMGYCYVRKRHTHDQVEILACTDCHNPHEGIGTKWKKTPDEDDATCLKCHQTYEDPSRRFRHTHHPAGSAGDRCLNCHMPRINEGMQDVVRTHTIFNPTWPSMIEANQPNACNLCHLDKPIDWTIAWLSRYYGLNRYTAYSETELEKNYPDRKGPVGLGWLKSPQEATRLVAVDALARERAVWALPQMLDMLDDPYLINRQFTRIALESMLGIRLSDHGYQFYQLPDERREPIARIRDAVLKKAVAD